eukprot:2780241-Prymnesium_polylepis.1
MSVVRIGRAGRLMPAAAAARTGVRRMPERVIERAQERRARARALIHQKLIRGNAKVQRRMKVGFRRMPPGSEGRP